MFTRPGCGAIGCVPGAYKVLDEVLSVARKQKSMPSPATNTCLQVHFHPGLKIKNGPHPEGRTFYGTRTGPYMSLEAGHTSSLGTLTVLTVLMVQQKQR